MVTVKESLPLKLALGALYYTPVTLPMKAEPLMGPLPDAMEK